MGPAREAAHRPLGKVRGRGTPVPSLVMDRPVLYPFVRELADSERFRAFLRAAPGHARPSLRARAPAPRRRAARGARPTARRPGSPRTRTRGTSPRRPAWFLGDEPRRAPPEPRRQLGARGSSRRRTSSASGLAPSTCSPRGGLVSASASALAEGMPPARARPEPILIAPGDEPGIDALAEQLALAGYERVDQAQERGQFALRGGIVDVYPTTGREPLRIELFGDEIESIRAFSPFTQRTLHPRRRRRRSTRLPSAASISSSQRSRTTKTRARLADPRRPRRADPRRARFRLAARGGPRGLGRGGAPAGRPRAARSSSTRSRAGQPFAFEAQRPAIAARGLSEAENELRAFVRGGLRTVVAFPHQGEALRTQNLAAPRRRAPDRRGRRAPGRGGAPVRRQPGAPRLRLARPRPRAAPRHAGLPPPHARPSRARRPRAPVLRRAPHGRLRRPRGPRRRQAARLRDERGRRRHARLPPARVPRRGPPLRPARADRQGLALHRRRRQGADALEARRQGLAEPQEPRARPRSASSPASCSQLYAQRQNAPGDRVRPRRRSGSSGSRPRSRTARRPTRRRAIEAVKEDLEAPRPMDRLVCGDVGFGKTEVAVRAAFAAALNGKQTLMLVPTTVLAQQHWNTFRERYRDFPVTRRDGLALPQAGRRRSASWPTSPRARSTS